MQTYNICGILDVEQSVAPHLHEGRGHFSDPFLYDVELCLAIGVRVRAQVLQLVTSQFLEFVIMISQVLELVIMTSQLF